MKRSLARELNEKIGKKVFLQGWVATRRDHGKIIFIDLRDRTGITQVVFVPNGDTYASAQTLRPEWVVQIEGTVAARPKGMENEHIASGKVELKAEKLTILAESDTLPFEIQDTVSVSEEIRMKYRYLDLRSGRMTRNLKKRAEVISLIRSELASKDFTEIETPLLTKSTPEGARDYVVPSRLHQGMFYALPQSPQQYKQLLMVAGIERYFQIARCFRDEDTRGDRQSEFTQLDIEMSFTDEQEVMDLVEELYIKIIATAFPQKKITLTPFPRLTHGQAMKRYRSDRPDLRKDTTKDSNELAFVWITDFPMFEWHVKEKRWSAAHHPFTAPVTKDVKALSDQKNVKARQYDLALNGSEIGGGSMRTTDPKMLSAVLEALGHSKEEIMEQFGHLLKAFTFGVPPHGGIALGLDRLLAIALNEPSIREVIAFPKTGDGRDLLMETPSTINQQQLKELHIRNV
ncbi:aspartate--tRNA ligase [Candidatus Berkelbacteria bacterium]|nr:aspartate--tRNA ligase [Candidatus Berkelbacteria bacterium]